MNTTQIVFGLVTGLFVFGIVYGINGGTIPAVAVMIVSTIGATVFGLATASITDKQP